MHEVPKDEDDYNRVDLGFPLTQCPEPIEILREPKPGLTSYWQT